jgi:hypothetical protein
MKRRIAFYVAIRGNQVILLAAGGAFSFTPLSTASRPVTTTLMIQALVIRESVFKCYNQLRYEFQRRSLCGREHEQPSNDGSYIYSFEAEGEIPGSSRRAEPPARLIHTSRPVSQ